MLHHTLANLNKTGFFLLGRKKFNTHGISAFLMARRGRFFLVDAVEFSILLRKLLNFFGFFYGTRGRILFLAEDLQLGHALRHWADFFFRAAENIVFHRQVRVPVVDRQWPSEVQNEEFFSVLVTAYDQSPARSFRLRSSSAKWVLLGHNFNYWYFLEVLAVPYRPFGLAHLPEWTGNAAGTFLEFLGVRRFRPDFSGILLQFFRLFRMKPVSWFRPPQISIRWNTPAFPAPVNSAAAIFDLLMGNFRLRRSVAERLRTLNGWVSAISSAAMLWRLRQLRPLWVRLSRLYRLTIIRERLLGDLLAGVENQPIDLSEISEEFRSTYRRLRFRFLRRRLMFWARPWLSGALSNFYGLKRTMKVHREDFADLRTVPTLAVFLQPYQNSSALEEFSNYPIPLVGFLDGDADPFFFQYYLAANTVSAESVLLYFRLLLEALWRGFLRDAESLADC